MATAPQARVTPAHLALVRELIEVGQTARALELLDAVWQPRVAEEQCWYLRLWAVAAEGRILEALELARVAGQELPGSAAVAYLQAALEHASNAPTAALESALRAAAIAPDHPQPAALVALFSRSPAAAGGAAVGSAHFLSDLPVPDSPPALADAQLANPVAAAQVGAALLHPPGSGRPLLPLRAATAPDAVPAPAPAPEVRRFGVIATAMVVAALWAIHDPIPAAVALTVTVLWSIRRWRA